MFHDTPLPGVVVVEPELVRDERGWFARTFAAEEFEAAGLAPAVVHCNLSFNARAGTLRGMHYQADPFGECKLIRCTGGGLYDVAVDLRRDSPTYLRWHAVELTAERRGVRDASDSAAGVSVAGGRRSVPKFGGQAPVPGEAMHP